MISSFLLTRLPLDIKRCVDSFLSLQERYEWTSDQIYKFYQHLQKKCLSQYNIYYHHFRHIPSGFKGVLKENNSPLFYRKSRKRYQIDIDIFRDYNNIYHYHIVIHRQWQKDIYTPLNDNDKQKLKHFYLNFSTNLSSLFIMTCEFSKRAIYIMLESSNIILPGYFIDKYISRQKEMEIIVKNIKECYDIYCS